MTPFVPESVQRGLVLASRSPRRRDILRALGFEFEVDPASEEAEHGVACDDVFLLPEVLARRKCAEVARRRPNALVLAADTVVILGNDVLEKPVDDAEARAFLRRLSGVSHTVITGVALRRGNEERVGSERTRVVFRDLEDDEIARYVATGEGRDKAGSYAAQGVGAGLIRTIDGCFWNVVGLPVALVIGMLRALPESEAPS